eukprot:TRINITY_DN4608_c0_g1_i3.p1 TRINITY_DN4608_c0_g1~~TRINITY_DN4608_c0_g1_i3.p1  ORF type:complete len:571 (+),score=127.21 TRINITY_DN4608_c0_g1_i3:143-1855(+)
MCIRDRYQRRVRGASGSTHWPAAPMAINAFLIVTAVVVTAIVVFLSWYFVRLFKNPTEAEGNSAKWSHILVIFSLTLTGTSVLLPAMDQANGDGDIPMEDLWFAVFCTQAIISLAVIPWAIFYYENFNEIHYDAKTREVTVKKTCCDCSAARTATCYAFVAVAVVLIMLFMLWTYAGEMQIPVDSYSGKLKDYPATGVMETIIDTCLSTTLSTTSTPTVYECNAEETDLNLQVTLAVYVIAFFSFFGWFILVIFGGIGFFGLPFGLIHSWRTRIQGLSPRRRETLREEYGRYAQDVHHISRLMLNKFENNNYEFDKAEQERFRKFKKAYTSLATNFNNYKMMVQVSEQNENEACAHCMGLIAGIIGTIISIVWLAHIGLYVLPDPPVTGMLNTGLIFLDENVWGLFGTTLYAIFSFYLVLCVIQGNVDFGLNLLCCKLHPLVLGETLMSSFLFNAMILGITSFSVVQFVSQAFQGYAGSDSSATVLFHVSARNMQFFKYFFRNNVFVYVLLAVAFLNGARLICCAPKANDAKALLQEYNDKGESLQDRASNMADTRGVETEMVDVKIDGK